jgi:hypothetical protein
LSNFHHPQLSFVRGGIHPSMFEPTFALAAWCCSVHWWFFEISNVAIRKNFI